MIWLIVLLTGIARYLYNSLFSSLYWTCYLVPALCENALLMHLTEYEYDLPGYRIEQPHLE